MFTMETGNSGFETGDLLFGLAAVLWALAMIANRLFGPIRIIRRALYGTGVVIVLYGLARLANFI